MPLDNFTDPLLTRRATLAPSTFNREARTVEATLVSAENAVQRRDARGQFTERLSTEADAFSLHRDRLPVLDSHRQGSIADILGAVTNIRAEGGEVRATLNITSDAALALIESGALTGVSIGYRVAPSEWQTRGSDRIAAKWQLHEVSLVPAPADPNAILRSDNNMPDDPPLNRAQVNAEIRTLTRTAGLPTQFADGLIDRSATVEQARSALFDAITSRSTYIPAMQTGYSGDDPAVIRTRAADALAHRLGAPGELPEASREFRDQGLHTTLRMMLSASGEPGAWRMPVADLLQRSMTTSDLPNLLTETTNRLLQPAYQAALSPIRQRLTRVTTAQDFREQFEVRLSEAPSLELVEESGEITTGALTEEKESSQVATYARIVSTTFQALQNDDLGALGRLSVAMGQAAAERENRLLVSLLTANSGAGPTMGDGVALFNNASHHNAASSGAAIGAATLSAGVLAMRKQVGLDGTTPLNVSPQTLLVPAELETIARQQIATVYPQTASDVSVFQGGFDVAVEARLADAFAWFLFAATPTFVLAYLAGREGPTVDSRQGFEVLGVDTRVVLHVGVGAADWRFAYRNAGH
jgi:HK97 family phage prohead protease